MNLTTLLKSIQGQTRLGHSKWWHRKLCIQSAITSRWPSEQSFSHIRPICSPCNRHHCVLFSHFWCLNNWTNDRLLTLTTSRSYYSNSLQTGFVRHLSAERKNVEGSPVPETDKSKQPGDGVDDDNESEESQSVFQRFKKTYKKHGKVLIGVHVCTSIVWFGSFYYAVISGLDVIAFLEWLGLRESIVAPLKTGGVGNIAVAYLLYKLATPARYTVTITGTNYTIKYLRKTGKMPPIPEGERIRELYKDSKDKISSDLKTKQAETIADVKEKHKQIVDRIKTRKK